LQPEARKHVRNPDRPSREGVGREDGCRGAHPQGAHGRGDVRFVQSGRLADSHRQPGRDSEGVGLPADDVGARSAAAVPRAAAPRRARLPSDAGRLTVPVRPCPVPGAVRPGTETAADPGNALHGRAPDAQAGAGVKGGRTGSSRATTQPCWPRRTDGCLALAARTDHRSFDWCFPGKTGGSTFRKKDSAQPVRGGTTPVTVGLTLREARDGR
jgi:hypothetical protein